MIRAPQRSRVVSDITTLDTTDGDPQGAVCSGFVVWTGLYPSSSLDVSLDDRKTFLPVEHTSVYWVEKGQNIWLRGDGTETGSVDEWIWPAAVPDENTALLLSTWLATSMAGPRVIGDLLEDIDSDLTTQLPSDYAIATNRGDAPSGTALTAQITASSTERLVRVGGHVSKVVDGTGAGNSTILVTDSVQGTIYENVIASSTGVTGAPRAVPDVGPALVGSALGADLTLSIEADDAATDIWQIGIYGEIVGV